MNYMDMMRRQDRTRLALIEDGREYTYGQLIMLSEQISHNVTVFSSEPVSGKIHWICRETIAEQLIEFMAANERGEIPVIVPEERKEVLLIASAEREAGSQDVGPAINMPLVLAGQKQEVQDTKICMGVMTSGSTGEPKVLWRSYESWANYFTIQNQIFGIHEGSRLLAQGSLAFTGNLNMYLAAFFVGAAIVAQNKFQPREWETLIDKYQINGIYLIPSKLMCIPRVIRRIYPAVKSIISGSQGMNRTDAVQLKKIFPNADLTLYYGASELSYISYITAEEMTDDRGLVGKAFPGVQVEVREQQIYVTTSCCVAGVKCPYTVSDQGYLDESGRLHFTGRSDGVVRVHGHKVSLWRIEKVLTEQPEIQSVVVLNLPNQKSFHGQQRKDYSELQSEGDRTSPAQVHYNRVAFVVLQNHRQIDSAFLKRLRSKLSSYEMPGHFVTLPELPYRENGKIDTEKLQKIWQDKTL